MDIFSSNRHCNHHPKRTFLIWCVVLILTNFTTATGTLSLFMTNYAQRVIEDASLTQEKQLAMDRERVELKIKEAEVEDRRLRMAGAQAAQVMAEQ